MVIDSGRSSYFSSARCGQGLTDKAASELNGSPDGLGVALGDSELGWVVGTRLALVSDDESGREVTHKKVCVVTAARTARSAG